MCLNISVNSFLSTKDNYLKRLTITHNNMLFQSMASLLTTFYDDVIFWRHDGFFNFLRIMSNLARYSGRNICHIIKTGKYVNIHCLTFHNLQTELKYHDYSSTICILKRTLFLSRKCRKLGVSDDVIRKIAMSAKIFLHQNVSNIINS